MGEGKLYKIVIARPATIRYQEHVLSYLYDNFTFERASRIDENIIKTASTLSSKPARGRREKYLLGAEEDFRFILYKETRYFEIKIIYYIKEKESTVYVTDFFPTRMDPQRIIDNQ
ncbi:MAG: type II toxin-antitoxin system RelE/ParE family toxin [Imperialibacter sp.]|uniref:type II toxin-antitoxin system RelE/ParE family toxin n=1 Tax=Imperialibacter sp. TaxID=2038411 RepID=UPI0032EF3FC0